jgi:predicted AlkP superfamily pyrophosphatase or phosphodiesterase
VLLISVDGLHALDLTKYVALHSDSTLAELSRNGITYTNNSTSAPSDSFPGLASLVTGRIADHRGAVV